MKPATKGRNPKTNLGYGPLLGLLGGFVVWNAPTVGAQFSGIALIVIVSLDLLFCIEARHRLKPKVDCKGVFSADELIPARIHGIADADIGRNQLALQPLAESATCLTHNKDGIEITIRLPRGHHRVFTIRSIRQSPLGLFCLARVYQCPIDVVVGPRRAQVEQRSQSGIEFEIGGVRVAQTADPRRLVHWASSARTQQLMVKETSPACGQDPSLLSIIVDLGWKQEPSSEAVVERARAYAEDALSMGRPVELVTAGGSISDLDSVKQSSNRLTAVGGTLLRAAAPITRSTNGCGPPTVTRVNSQRDILEVLATATSGLGELTTPTGEVVHLCGKGDQWSAS